MFCGNTANVTSDNGYLGGVIGQVNGAEHGHETGPNNMVVYIRYCYNRGEISVTGNGVGHAAGGISGMNFGARIEFCYNIADVTSYGLGGGIGHFYWTVGNSNVGAYNCYSVGGVSRGSTPVCIGGVLTQLGNTYRFANNLWVRTGGMAGNGQECVAGVSSSLGGQDCQTTASTLRTTAIRWTRSSESTTGWPSDIPTFPTNRRPFVTDTSGINGGYPILWWER